MADDLPKITMEGQLECARRELKFRLRVYPRKVEAGHMTQKLADHELNAMRAIIATMDGLASKERLL